MIAVPTCVCISPSSNGYRISVVALLSSQCDTLVPTSYKYSPIIETNNYELEVLSSDVNTKFHINPSSDSSPNIVWEIKSRRMRWAGHVARMEEG